MYVLGTLLGTVFSFVMHKITKYVNVSGFLCGM